MNQKDMCHQKGPKNIVSCQWTVLFFNLGRFPCKIMCNFGLSRDSSESPNVFVIHPCYFFGHNYILQQLVVVCSRIRSRVNFHFLMIRLFCVFKHCEFRRNVVLNERTYILMYFKQRRYRRNCQGKGRTMELSLCVVPTKTQNNR